MSYIVAVAARWTKSLKFTLSIAVHRGGLAKNHFWLVATQKKRIGEQLNYFWNMCPKPFSWAKNKRKLFSDGKLRGPLLGRVALKTDKEQSLLRFKLSPALVPLSQRQNFGLQRILLEGLIIFWDAWNSSIKTKEHFWTQTEYFHFVLKHFRILPNGRIETWFIIHRQFVSAKR